MSQPQPWDASDRQDPRQRQGQYAPQVPYGQPYPAPHPRRAVSRQQMPVSLSVFHWTMMICTGGLWIPVYLSARRKRKTVTVFE